MTDRNPGPCLRRDGGHLRILQPRDIVDDARPSPQRGVGHTRPTGIDADRHAQRRQRFDDREYARTFGISIDRVGTRPGRFSPDVEDPRPRIDGCLCGGVRLVDVDAHAIAERTTVVKAVGRDVEDRHHDRSVEPQRARSVTPLSRACLGSAHRPLLISLCHQPLDGTPLSARLTGLGWTQRRANNFASMP